MSAPALFTPYSLGDLRLPNRIAMERFRSETVGTHQATALAVANGDADVATNNTAALRADDDRNAAILERIPAGRWGVPDDMMGPVVFLASSASDYINGYTVAVDGGWLAR